MIDAYATSDEHEKLWSAAVRHQNSVSVIGVSIKPDDDALTVTINAAAAAKHVRVYDTRDNTCCLNHRRTQ